MSATAMSATAMTATAMTAAAVSTTAVWTGDARDTLPIGDIARLVEMKEAAN